MKIGLAITIVLLTWPLAATARDLGVFGTTYAIQELDFLHVLEQRAAQLTQSGYFHHLYHALQQQAKQRLDRPPPVTDITTTIVSATWHYDPSITFSQDIRAPDGRRLIRAGSRYNPLRYDALDETLIFYNADDPQQVRWAKKRDHALKGKDKLILVQGSVTSQEKDWHKPVYFDQWGRLVHRFHIHHVPATVAQDGLRLMIREELP